MATALADPDDRRAWRAIELADEIRRQRLGVEPVGQREVLRFCRHLAPFEVEGHAKIRLGNENDSGYVFIDDFKDVSAVISCGISNDVSCDLAFAELDETVMEIPLNLVPVVRELIARQQA